MGFTNQTKYSVKSTFAARQLNRCARDKPKAGHTRYEREVKTFKFRVVRNVQEGGFGLGSRMARAGPGISLHSPFSPARRQSTPLCNRRREKLLMGGLSLHSLDLGPSRRGVDLFLPFPNFFHH